MVTWGCVISTWHAILAPEPGVICEKRHNAIKLTWKWTEFKKKQNDEDTIRQEAIVDVNKLFNQARVAKEDMRKEYAECKDIPQEKRVVIDNFFWKLKVGKVCIIYCCFLTAMLPGFLSPKGRGRRRGNGVKEKQGMSSDDLAKDNNNVIEGITCSLKINSSNATHSRSYQNNGGAIASVSTLSDSNNNTITYPKTFDLISSWPTSYAKLVVVEPSRKSVNFRT
nr:hypothetical protein [Tanacetum cinerariifolium]